MQLFESAQDFPQINEGCRRDEYKQCFDVVSCGEHDSKIPEGLLSLLYDFRLGFRERLRRVEAGEDVENGIMAGVNVPCGHCNRGVARDTRQRPSVAS